MTAVKRRAPAVHMPNQPGQFIKTRFDKSHGVCHIQIGFAFTPPTMCQMKLVAYTCRKSGPKSDTRIKSRASLASLRTLLPLQIVDKRRVESFEINMQAAHSKRLEGADWVSTRRWSPPHGCCLRVRRVRADHRYPQIGLDTFLFDR